MSLALKACFRVDISYTQQPSAHTSDCKEKDSKLHLHKNVRHANDQFTDKLQISTFDFKLFPLKYIHLCIEAVSVITGKQQ